MTRTCFQLLSCTRRYGRINNFNAVIPLMITGSILSIRRIALGQSNTGDMRVVGNVDGAFYIQINSDAQSSYKLIGIALNGFTVGIQISIGEIERFVIIINSGIGDVQREGIIINPVMRRNSRATSL